MSDLTPSMTPEFSLREARTAIGDCLRPNHLIYWVDFLLTVMAGHICFGVARTLTAELYLSGFAPEGGWVSPVSPLLPTTTSLRIILQAFTSVAACLLFYRAAMFIHELVHRQRGTFTWFRVTWNTLCGVPFLMPSFVYHTHVDHHRREHYGTEHDGEYLAFQERPPIMIFLWLLHPLIVPPLTVFRFLLLTPLAWLIPPLRRLVHKRMSSMIIDPAYIRPLPSKSAQRIIYLQEAACFLWCIFIPIFATRVFGGILPFLVQAYVTAVFLLLLNGLRTLGSHRWVNQGKRMSFVDQLLDSVNYPNHRWITGVWGPVGSRFHALHHLFPTLPYHNAAAAHRALIANLPETSPYRQTSARSLTGALLNLWRRSAANHANAPEAATATVEHSS
jgi:fatty acid desaturase